MFLYFYSAIFQLTSAKFQTFAYNSRTVGSSYMKFGQQFEINELYVCTQFRGNRSRDFDFRTQKPPPQVWRKKQSQSKTAKVRQKIFHMVVCLNIPFHPNQPTFGHDEVHFFFYSFSFPLFFSQFLYSLLLLHHKTSKSKFCVKLLSCKCNFFSRNFWATPSRTPQNGGPKKSIF